MRLYRTATGPVVEAHGLFYSLAEEDWDGLLTRSDLLAYLRGQIQAQEGENALPAARVLAPIGSQEVWAAGVTYYRSRTARMEESKSAGGGSFYDRVYEAERPELFFKALASKVSGPHDAVRIRVDSRWNVPEPELALVINPSGTVIGYTVGNDMSSRDIEGENPLYLPQAKVYDQSCALGPCILLQEEFLDRKSEIRLEIRRGDREAFLGTTHLSELKREPAEMASWLYKESTFPTGCILLTGTGIIPPDNFTLAAGDEVHISITGIGTLINTVVQGR